jgi:hypothetical protein
LTPRQAAAFIGRSPQELQDLIHSGQIRAQHMANTGGTMIPREDLIAFLKSRSETTKYRRVKPPKAILIEPDYDKALMMKGDLERGSSLRVAIVQDARDLARELDKGSADLIAMRLMDEAPLPAELIGLLGKARVEQDARLLFYHQRGEDLLDRKPELKQQLDGIGADAVVPYSARLQPVLERIKAIFTPPPPSGPART